MRAKETYKKIVLALLGLAAFAGAAQVVFCFTEYRLRQWVTYFCIALVALLLLICLGALFYTLWKRTKKRWSKIICLAAVVILLAAIGFGTYIACVAVRFLGGQERVETFGEQKVIAYAVDGWRVDTSYYVYEYCNVLWYGPYKGEYPGMIVVG